MGDLHLHSIHRESCVIWTAVGGGLITYNFTFIEWLSTIVEVLSLFFYRFVSNIEVWYLFCKPNIPSWIDKTNRFDEKTFNKNCTKTTNCVHNISDPSDYMYSIKNTQKKNPTRMKNCCPINNTSTGLFFLWCKTLFTWCEQPWFDSIFTHKLAKACAQQPPKKAIRIRRTVCVRLSFRGSPDTFNLFGCERPNVHQIFPDNLI